MCVRTTTESVWEDVVRADGQPACGRQRNGDNDVEEVVEDENFREDIGDWLDGAELVFFFREKILTFEEATGDDRLCRIRSLPWDYSAQMAHRMR